MPNRVRGYAGGGGNRPKLGPCPPFESGSDVFDRVHAAHDIPKMQSRAIPPLLPSVGQYLGMGTRETLAENLKRLIKDAADNKRPKGYDNKSLGKAAGIAASTVGRILDCDNAPNIDTLSALAAVYKLPAWVLLTEDLDPANPPQPQSASARRFYRRMQELAKDLQFQGDEEDGPVESHPSEGAGDDSHSKEPAARKGRDKATGKAVPKKSRT